MRLHLFAIDNIMSRQISFDVSARTAKLIGKENFANANGAVIELIKNSYDADATVAMVVFYKDALYIIDNWSWMTEDIIINNWMKIGTDNKQITFETEGKRIKSWAKWIWRFALDRLWKVSEMYTKDKHSHVINYWKVNWEQFNTSASISEVKAHLESLASFDLKQFLLSEIPNLKEFHEELNKIALDHWTILKLTNLNDSRAERDVNSLFSNLELLVPPFTDINFSIFLFSDKITSEYWRIKTAYDDEFDYKVSAKYFWDKSHTLRVEIIRNELDVEKIKKDYMDVFLMREMLQDNIDIKSLEQKKIEKTMSLNVFPGFDQIDQNLLDKIWAFDFSFYFLKNSLDQKEKYPYKVINTAHRKVRLEKFWWVKIFRDNFRVRPYWEKGNDRLLLWERQAQSPQWAWQRLWWYRIRPNQISGIVQISRIHNSYLEDKSWREWIQENEVFTVFRNILINIIEIFEKDRNKIMYAFNELDKKRNKNSGAKDRAWKAAKEVEKKEKEGTATEEEKALLKGNELLEKEVKNKNLEIRMLRNLASTWLIISSFAHELKGFTIRLWNRSSILRKMVNRISSPEVLKKLNKDDHPDYIINTMENEDYKLQNWITYSIYSLKRSRRERKNIDLTEYFSEFIKLRSVGLEQKNIKISFEDKTWSKTMIKGFEIDLDSIFNNLISNSINSLARVKSGEKKIAIKLTKENEYAMIYFHDNWPGLDKEFIDHPEEIFNAFITSKVDKYGNKIWTWLGMYIVNSIVSEYEESKIQIEEYHDKFTISLQFKIV